jgi:hypothetical protein
MSSITETAEIDMPDRMSAIERGYKCIGFRHLNLCSTAYGEAMETLAAVAEYLRMLLDGWDSMTDLQRREAVTLALDAAGRPPTT